jgi:hypothetical protein
MQLTAAAVTPPAEHAARRLAGAAAAAAADADVRPLYECRFVKMRNHRAKEEWYALRERSCFSVLACAWGMFGYRVQ